MSSREIMDAQGFSEAINNVNCDNFRDPVVKRVVEKFKTRSDAGYANTVRLFTKREQQK